MDFFLKVQNNEIQKQVSSLLENENRLKVENKTLKCQEIELLKQINENTNFYVFNKHINDDKKSQTKCTTIGCDGKGNTNSSYKTHSCLKSCPNKVILIKILIKHWIKKKCLSKG